MSCLVLLTMPITAHLHPAHNPYAALRQLRRLHWWNRVRQQPTQSALHATALLSLLALLLPLALNATTALGPVLQSRWDSSAPGFLALVALLALLDQFFALRRQQQRWRNHWLWAQPIAREVRQAERRRRLVLGGVIHSLLVLGLSALCERPALLGGLLLIALTALLATPLHRRWGRPSRRQAPSKRVRETPFVLHGRGSLSRWQWQQLGSTLAAKRLAPLWLLCLLLPRGPATMGLIGFYLMWLGALVIGWRRCLQVIPAAEHWLRFQPLPAGRWLGAICVLPLLLLAVLALSLAMPGLFLEQPALAAVAALAAIGLGLLHLATCLRWRRQPRRIDRQFALHCIVLLACAQTLPPLAPLLWLLQLGLLARGALGLERRANATRVAHEQTTERINREQRDLE